jgi:hypothetical protein
VHTRQFILIAFWNESKQNIEIATEVAYNRNPSGKEILRKECQHKFAESMQEAASLCKHFNKTPLDAINYTLSLWQQNESNEQLQKEAREQLEQTPR